MFTDFLGNPRTFEIAGHDPTTGYIEGSFFASLSSTTNNSGYIYFNNLDTISSLEDRATLNTQAIGSWHLPDKNNWKPGVVNSDFNSNFSLTTGLRGAAANFANTASDSRTVRADLLNSQTTFTVEAMFLLNSLSSISSLLTVPSTTVGSLLNIRTHNDPESAPFNGLKLRMVGPGGGADYYYRTINLVINRWYHLAAIFRSSGVLSLYLDGELITPAEKTTVAAGAPVFASTDLIYLGGAPPSNFMNGKLDDFLIISGAMVPDSIKWRARNSLYRDSSFTMALMESPGTANDNMAGIYFDTDNSTPVTININDHLVSPGGRTAVITSFTQPASGEGSVAFVPSSTTAVKYSPPASFVGTPDFTITVSTS
jgi:hypothetical protein